MGCWRSVVGDDGQHLDRGRCKAAGATDGSSSWLFPVLLIFLVGAIFGGMVGYLIGYIKHYRVIFIPRPPRPQQQQPTILEPSAPRNRTPQWRAPDQILITKTGGSFHMVNGCSSTVRGEDARTNKVLERCTHCFPQQREQ